MCTIRFRTRIYNDNLRLNKGTTMIGFGSKDSTKGAPFEKRLRLMMSAGLKISRDNQDKPPTEMYSGGLPRKQDSDSRDGRGFSKRLLAQRGGFHRILYDKLQLQFIVIVTIIILSNHNR